MAVIAFSENEAISISGHFLSSICKTARQHSCVRQHNHLIQKIENSNEINLSILTNAEIEFIANAIESLLNIINEQSNSVVNAYAGLDDLLVKVQQAKGVKA